MTGKIFDWSKQTIASLFGRKSLQKKLKVWERSMFSLTRTFSHQEISLGFQFAQNNDSGYVCDILRLFIFPSI